MSQAPPHPVLGQPFAELFRARSVSSRRASSYDRTGANADYVQIGPGETAVLLRHDGPGCLAHLYCAMILPDLRDYRAAILRCYWDGAEAPSVEVPLGDFFGLAHARVRTFASQLLAVNPGCGSSHGLNAYFAMPFDSAVVTLENRGSTPLGGARGALWYHIDYEVYDEPLPDGVDRFHASYRQERPTSAAGGLPNVTLHGAPDTDGAENYVALDTAGAGRLVGLVLEVENVQGAKWYGEGDDMVFIDGEPWPPSVHGTGTEEIFGGGACLQPVYAAPYSGFHLIESPAFDGLAGMYRWFGPDAIHFATSLRWTIEHRRADNFAKDYSSVAYWYQTPRAILPELPSHGQLAPPLGLAYDAAFASLAAAKAKVDELAVPGDPTRLLELCAAADPLYFGRFDAAREAIAQLRDHPDWR